MDTSDHSYLIESFILPQASNFAPFIEGPVYLAGRAKNPSPRTGLTISDMPKEFHRFSNGFALFIGMDAIFLACLGSNDIVFGSIDAAGGSNTPREQITFTRQKTLDIIKALSNPDLNLSPLTILNSLQSSAIRRYIDAREEIAAAVSLTTLSISGIEPTLTGISLGDTNFRLLLDREFSEPLYSAARISRTNRLLTLINSTTRTKRLSGFTTISYLIRDIIETQFPLFLVWGSDGTIYFDIDSSGPMNINQSPDQILNTIITSTLKNWNQFEAIHPEHKGNVGDDISVGCAKLDIWKLIDSLKKGFKGFI